MQRDRARGRAGGRLPHLPLRRDARRRRTSTSTCRSGRARRRGARIRSRPRSASTSSALFELLARPSDMEIHRGARTTKPEPVVGCRTRARWTDLSRPGGRCPRPRGRACGRSRRRRGGWRPPLVVASGSEEVSSIRGHARPATQQLAGQGHAVAVGQVDVEQDRVRLQPRGHERAVRGRARLADRRTSRRRRAPREPVTGRPRRRRSRALGLARQPTVNPVRRRECPVGRTTASGL